MARAASAENIAAKPPIVPRSHIPSVSMTTDRKAWKRARTIYSSTSIISLSFIDQAGTTFGQKIAEQKYKYIIAKRDIKVKSPAGGRGRDDVQLLR